MNLRKHQQEMVEICGEILSGKEIRTIIASVTPGGGKSALPVILAENLIPEVATKICWVVPRNSLKYQGEAEFLEPGWGTRKRIRAAGNQGKLSWGCDGYITTYQAIGQNPEVHALEFQEEKYILFLDEPHHIQDDGSWKKALAPLVESAVLVVFASGTLSRGDGQKIAFLEYLGDFVHLEDREHTRVIRYTRKDAIREGSVVPVQFQLLDGKAQWLDESGSLRESDSLFTAGSDSAAALFTVLRTEYAFHLLEEAVNDWEITRKEFPEARLLVVAPDIKHAAMYLQHLRNRVHCRIATSQDTIQARQNIEDYKKDVFEALITVAMAYEGLSVKAITHVACLTNIRSVPWLEQCFARANRLCPGKTQGVIFAPADPKFRKAIRMIETEQLVPLADQEDQTQQDLFQPQEPREGGGEAKPWIHPLASAVEGREFSEQPAAPLGTAPSEQENILRANIRRIRESVLMSRRPGALLTTSRKMARIKRSVADKPIDEMNVHELTQYWMKMREAFGGLSAV